MGGSNSVLTNEMLEEYVVLTYLTKSEILYIFKKFSKLGHDTIQSNYYHRFPVADVAEIFPELKYNPFADRLYHVFSSQHDLHYSFEDILDLCSVMSESCPLKVKVAWAFKIFDFNDDDSITQEDIWDIVDRLTKGNKILDDDKKFISDTILNDMDFLTTGGMKYLEFMHAITKMPEFLHSFQFKP